MKTKYTTLNLLKIIALLVIPLFTQLNAELIEEVYFVVNDEIITKLDYKEQEDYYLRAASRTGQELPENISHVIISNMITSLLIKQEAEKNGILVSGIDVSNRINQIIEMNPGIKDLNHLKQLLPAEGMSYEYFYKQQENNMYMQELVGRLVTVIEPTAQEIEKHYNAHKAEKYKVTEPLYRLARVLIKKEPGTSFTDHFKLKKKVEAVRLEIQNGLAFDKAAAKYSEDLSSKNTGGETGWIFIEELGLDPENMMILKKLKKGDLSEVVSASDGFNIFKILEIKKSGHIPFEKASSIIKNELIMVKKQDSLDDKLQQIKRKSAIIKKTSDFKSYIFK